MSDKQYPRFQYSEFIKDGGRDGQIVIRSDNKEEFEEDKRYIDKIISKYNQPEEEKKTISNQAGFTNPSVNWVGERQGKSPMTTGEGYCSIHKTEMKGREGKFGYFYSHTIGKDGNGKWIYCNGKVK